MLSTMSHDLVGVSAHEVTFQAVEVRSLVLSCSLGKRNVTFSIVCDGPWNWTRNDKDGDKEVVDDIVKEMRLEFETESDTAFRFVNKSEVVKIAKL